MDKLNVRNIIKYVAIGSCLLTSSHLWGAFNFDAQLFDAAKSGNVNGVHEAARQGANVNAPDRYGRTPLHYAVREGRLDAIVALFERGANVNVVDTVGWTPLRYAVIYKKQWAIPLLIAKGADVNIWDNRVGTLLHVIAGNVTSGVAADNNRADVVRMLIRLGINVNALNRNNQTALDIARQGGTDAAKEIASLLRTYGAKTSAEIGR
ncbi:MAG: ankyrin repeat domain-containing protein [Puniceicoccales bacterium]|jgi:ankyrin repeat protein|nr:ankyrin repeat domain-containing protein [Puniceicoccales bacterium]